MKQGKSGIKRGTGIRETGIDRGFTIVNYIVIGILFLIVLYPIIYVVSCSFSSASALMRGSVKLFPVDVTLEGYKAVFEYDMVWVGYANSIFYTVVGTLINVVMTVLLAYPLSRKNLIGKKVVMSVLVFTMVFNAGMIPNYLLLQSLGMVNTRWALLIPGAINTFNTMVTITFFKTNIPDDLLDAAKIDGASDFYFLRKIVLPLSGAIIAVITLYYAVGHWNAYFDAMIYINDPDLKPLQLVLRSVLVNNELNLEALNSMDQESLAAIENRAMLLKYSLIVVSSAPMVAAYPFVQKYFVKGVMIGSVKG